MRAALDAARSGRPTIVLVVGEAGIGKTRLADEAAVDGQGGGHAGTPGRGGRLRREPMELWRGVYRALGVEPVSDPTLPAEERRWEHLENVDRRADPRARRPLVVLEDLHWADRDRRSGCSSTCPGHSATRPIAFVATSRDHEPDMPRLDGAAHGFAARAARRARRRGGAPARRGGARRDGRSTPSTLHARTGGNPLFVQELVRSPDGERRDQRGPRARRSSASTSDTRGLWPPPRSPGPARRSPLIATATGRDDGGGRRSGSTPAVARGRPRRGGARRRALPPCVVRRGRRAASATPTRSHDRLATAWEAPWAALDGAGVGGGTPACAPPRAPRTVADAVPTACEVAAELVAAGPAGAGRRAACGGRAGGRRVRRPSRAARAGWRSTWRRSCSWLGDLDRALTRYQEAAELARGRSDPVLRARAEVGADLWCHRVRARPARACAGWRTRFGRAPARGAASPGDPARAPDDRRSAPMSTRPTRCGRGPTRRSRWLGRRATRSSSPRPLLDQSMAPTSRGGDRRRHRRGRRGGRPRRAGRAVRPRAAAGTSAAPATT